MQKVNRALTAAAMVAVATVSVQVWAAEARQQPEVPVDARRADVDFDRWKPLVVLSAFVDLTNETVTLRGLNFGKKVPTVFCETQQMRVLSASNTELVVRFPKAIADGTYLFTVARGFVLTPCSGDA